MPVLTVWRFAQTFVDKTRELLDTELTALAGEVLAVHCTMENVRVGAHAVQ
jgi:hypothetical protein